MENDELKIGKIVIRKMTDELVNNLADKLEMLLRTNPYFNPKDKDARIEFILGRILEFKDKVCAEFKMFGEESIVLEIAKKECEKSLDLLRLSSIFLHHKDHKIKISLEGETARGFQKIIIFKSNLKDYKLTTEIIGPIFDFTISDESISNMEQLGILTLSGMLEKTERELTDFEKTLLLGIHWLANFPIQREVENQYLSLMVVLEIYLTPGFGESITNYIAEGASIILAKGIDNKKTLKGLIKELYNKRSSIVHGRF